MFDGQAWLSLSFQSFLPFIQKTFSNTLQLQQESGSQNNARSGAAFYAIKRAVASSFASVADGIQLANAFAIITNGLHVIVDVADSGSSRTNTMDPAIVLEKISKSWYKFSQTRAFYIWKCFTVTNLVAFIVGGHSLDRFGLNRQIETSKVFFLNLIGRSNQNVVQCRSSGASLPDFNTLQTDDNLNKSCSLWYRLNKLHSSAQRSFCTHTDGLSFQLLLFLMVDPLFHFTICNLELHCRRPRSAAGGHSSLFLSIDSARSDLVKK